MPGSFDNYQALYSNGPPDTAIRLGQILVDESEADPLDMLKVCTDLSPLTYESVAFQSQIPTVPVGANPTASVGLSAVNGSAATFMRSDAAPALDQAIAPTWTGAHTFTAGLAIEIENNQPAMQFEELDQGADGKKWRFRGNGGNLVIETRLDDNSVGTTAIQLQRSGSAVTAINFGNTTDNPTTSFLGTGTVSLSADSKELRFGTGGDDLAIYHDGTNNFIDSNTGALRLRDSAAAVKFEINSTGVGFNAATPIARPDYTITNPTTNRSIDVSAATLALLRQVVGTMIQDLIDYGLYQ